MYSKHIFAGANHAGYLQDGTAYVWGDNLCGELGLGFCSKSVEKPTKVRLPHDRGKIIKISWSNTHVLFLSLSGKVFASGLNNCGQAGGRGGVQITVGGRQNLVKNHLQEITIGNGGKIVDILALGEASFFLTESGKPYSCGNHNAALGYKCTCNQFTPKLIETFRNKRIKSFLGNLSIWNLRSRNEIFFIDDEGNVYNCRHNETPTRWQDIKGKVEHGYGGENNNIFINISEGEAWLYGSNNANRLCLFNRDYYNLKNNEERMDVNFISPAQHVKLEEIKKVKDIACGTNFTAVLSNSYNDKGGVILTGSLDVQEDYSFCATLPLNNRKVAEIAAGYYFLLVLDIYGNLYMYPDTDPEERKDKKYVKKATRIPSKQQLMDINERKEFLKKKVFSERSQMILINGNTRPKPIYYLPEIFKNN